MKRFLIVIWLWGLWVIVPGGILVDFAHGDGLASQTAPQTARRGGAAQDEAATKVSVSKEACAQLPSVVPADGGAYTPGVDVNGKPVAPADLNGATSPFAVPQNIVIDFGVDIAKRYGLDALGYSATSKLWTVGVKDGKLYVDDKPLKDEDAEAIAKACRRAYGP
ncbi:hypothetical protein [Varunaivibrio sulfuroxidans]|uniref:Uncharacterized protein n=1 Tax=Varunaivibrio sulfuroxidans TaxID=1773489 RepID=A0A4R3JF83_9PROT|nr:hypothetical protein [Varunaivibrio sulfuroxidans]TCS64145.1 hypothetical protein EDD55_102187 [Varunaivibrio sulfuroxidans]WES31408.1 hypothetical protein P3M64_03275 [Varunaivibrio sulfuroxidans]